MEDKPIESGLVLAEGLDGDLQIGTAIAISSLPDCSVALAFAAVGVAASGIDPEDCGSEFFLAAILASASAICCRAAAIAASSPESVDPTGEDCRRSSVEISSTRSSGQSTKKSVTEGFTPSTVTPSKSLTRTSQIARIWTRHS